MRKFLFAVMLMTIPFPVIASDMPAGIERYIDQPKTIGSGTMRMLMVNLYDATIFGPRGQFDADQKFALSLHYHRTIKGRMIVDKTMDEIRHQGLRDEVMLALWYNQLVKIFPDVQDGTILTGIYEPNRRTVFLKDGKMIGKIQDPAFGPYFFNIWLGPKTRAPELRQQLLKGYHNEVLATPCPDRNCHGS